MVLSRTGERRGGEGLTAVMAGDRSASMKWSARRVGETLLRVSLGVAFVVAGVIKARHPFEFCGTVYEFGYASERLGVFVAAELPWLEIVAGIFLLMGVLPRGSSLLACLLTTLYVAVLAGARAQGVAAERAFWGPFGPESAGLLSLGYASLILVMSAANLRVALNASGN